MNLKNEIADALARINAHIDSRFRGSRIATGKHVSKIKWLLGIHPNRQRFCECGQLWDAEDEAHSTCGWCGATEPTP